MLFCFGFLNLFAHTLSAQFIHIPDPNLKNALLTHNPRIDLNGDGQINFHEALLVDSLAIGAKSISNLNGLEAFTNLKWLHCEENNLTSLDLSPYTSLTWLSCQANKLTSLDFMNNSELTYVQLDHNELTTLNLSNKQFLHNISCMNNKLTNLDISNSLALQALSCDFNQLIELDLSNYPDLYYISCSYNQLTSLNIANGNSPSFIVIVASFNPNLPCIQVDPGFEDFYHPSSFWYKDTTAVWSEDCSNFVAVQKTEATNIEVFPNPSSDLVYVSTDEIVQAIHVYNLQGQLLKEEYNQREISLAEFSKGIYLLKIQTPKGWISQQIVKD